MGHWGTRSSAMARRQRDAVPDAPDRLDPLLAELSPQARHVNVQRSLFVAVVLAIERVIHEPGARNGRTRAATERNEDLELGGRAGDHLPAQADAALGRLDAEITDHELTGPL